ncbi:transposase [Streptomyces sp. KS 21]|uniref:IS701 family transposase n=1 Tax=Streptomyces sp. KS 21 TaxID=2485150 RepID=UPI0010EA0E92|nr:transposase [Streptomyces sp. KS 21]TDU76961.1 SRSO17 transposase [Streptomyces sp. KS 21]
MNTTISSASSSTYQGVPAGRRKLADEAVEELCAAVFTSLRRKDQRERGRQYVRGLLGAEGRKSIRNIAQQLGAGAGATAAEQSLHHFIAASTWDWQPIRAALAQYLGQAAPLDVWVAQPMAIPKGGEHSVGAGHRFDPHRGQMFRGQQAFGMWFTSPGVVTPVGWRLFLGEEPEAAQTESYEGYEECAVTGVLDTLRESGLATRPVVLDIRDIATRATLNRFAEARVPVVGRISPEARLLVTDPRLPGFGAGTLAARDILQNVRGLRMPVQWAAPDAPGARRTSLVAAVRVMVPDPAPGRRREVLLFGEWESARRLPTQLWVTDMVRTDPGALVRMTKTAHQVSAAAGLSVQEIGLRDFSGRSLPGWHRHVTLASVAHAARCLEPVAPPLPARHSLVRRPRPQHPTLATR